MQLNQLDFSKQIFNKQLDHHAIADFVPFCYPKLYVQQKEQTNQKSRFWLFDHFFFWRKLDKFSFRQLLISKKALTLAVVSLALPLQSFTLNKDVQTSTLNKIMNHQSLKVATINDTTTFFASDGFEHGFGYDVSRHYANHLGADLQISVFDSEQKALQALQDGLVDMALTNATPLSANEHNLSNISLACEKDFLIENGLNHQASWQVRLADKKLAQNAQAFICDRGQLAINKQLSAFYNQNVFKDFYSQQHFMMAMNESLPVLQSAFEQNAQYYNHDWQLLVAMGYQESHLQADAISPTGVQGIMMLTNDTAAEMGVTDRVDPDQSIAGGAKYLKVIQKQFHNIPNPDRLWFALAAYNMGPTAVKNIQAAVFAQGLNGHSWAEVYRYMAENRHENSRYVQCLDYVTNIRGYLEVLKRDKLKKVA